MVRRWQVPVSDETYKTWEPPPPQPRQTPWKTIGVVAGFVVLAAFLILTVLAWQGTKGDLATTSTELADVTDERDGALEEVSALEAGTQEMEGALNGANLTLSSARSCITGLRDATDAVKSVFVPEDWGTFYDRLQDVRGTCRQVMNAANSVF